MKTFRVCIEHHGIGTILFLLLMSFLQFMGCGGKDGTPPPKTEQTSPPQPIASQVTVVITKIDDTTLQSGQALQVGQQVIVEGTISDPKMAVCVLVHPLNGDTWWVQNLPSPPGRIDEKTWRWRTLAFCGTEKLGLNEDFEIVALAESQRAVCQLGKTFKMPDFPNELPRSEIITDGEQFDVSAYAIPPDFAQPLNSPPPEADWVIKNARYKTSIRKVTLQNLKRR